MADSDLSNIKIYVHQGETYIGNFTDPSNQLKVTCPVKITFNYENTSTTSAKLTWLLSPVMPHPLTTTDNKPTLIYNEGSIIKLQNAAGNDFDGTMIDSNVIMAYRSVTNQNG